MLPLAGFLLSPSYSVRGPPSSNPAAHIQDGSSLLSSLSLEMFTASVLVRVIIAVMWLPFTP